MVDFKFCRICGEQVHVDQGKDGLCVDCQELNLVEAKVVVTALVNLENEVKEKAKEQYSLEDDKKIAQNMLSNSTINGLNIINFQDHYWDGVANLKGSIFKVNVDFLKEEI